MVWKSFCFLLSVFGCLFLIANSTFAQGTTSRLTGTVTDASGAAVSGAAVTLTDEGTQTSLSAVTGESGAYAFDLIQPGNYTVTIERQGFKKFTTTGNAVNVNQPATVNVALETGGVAETVTV